MYRYRRAARTAAELNLGMLAPLYRAIPELSAMVPDSSPPAPKRRKRSQSETSGAQMKPNAADGNGPSAFRFRRRDTWRFESSLAHDNGIVGRADPGGCRNARRRKRW
jgi:hypothetical protein